MISMKGKRLNLWLPDGYDEKIKELLDMFDAQGVDVRDPKKPDNLSQSAMIRHLIDEALKKAGRNG
jgi:hypothetical protein